MKCKTIEVDEGWATGKGSKILVEWDDGINGIFSIKEFPGLEPMASVGRFRIRMTQKIEAYTP